MRVQVISRHSNCLTVICFYLCYFVYYLCVMMCVCRILINITYLLTYLLTGRAVIRSGHLRQNGRYEIRLSL